MRARMARQLPGVEMSIVDPEYDGEVVTLTAVEPAGQMELGL